MSRLLSTALVSVLLLSFGVEGNRNIDPVLQRAIDTFVEKIYFPMSQVNALGLSIVQNDGEVLYTTGYGLADQEKRIPNGNDTQFLIGSCTKSLTSAVVIKVLHEKFPEMGESVLDAPIRKLLPQVNFTLNDRFRSEHVSFRDMLSHRVCLFRDDFNIISGSVDTGAEVMYRQRYNEEICGVRSEFQYNNQMYTSAGELAGILAGKSYTELAEDLMKEIGMNSSAFTKVSDDFSQMPNRAQPYYVMDNKVSPINRELVKRIVPYNAAGGLFLTPNDMAKYTQFLMNNGKVEGKQIVPEEVMKWMTKPAIFLPNAQYKDGIVEPLGSYYAYGLGLMMGDHDGWQHITHGGYFAPYASAMSFFPAKKLGIFTSSNMGPVLVDQLLLHMYVFDLLEGTENPAEKAIAAMQKHLEDKAKDKSKEQQLLRQLKKEEGRSAPVRNAAEIVGKYGSGASGELEIVEKTNNETGTVGLYLTQGKWAGGWLESFVGDIYKIVLDTDMVTDNYAGGDKEGLSYCIIANETVQIFSPSPTGLMPISTKFKLGVRLDLLPPVPWSPDSCGPTQTE